MELNEDQDQEYGTLLQNNKDIESIQKQNQKAFITKVYGILCVQLAMTTIFCIPATISDSFQNFAIENDWLMWLAFAFAIIVELLLLCVRDMAKRVPTNYILLGIFTLCESYLVACICSTYDPEIVLSAALLCTGICLSLTLYACFTKTDFTAYYAIAIVACFCLSFFGFMLLFLGTGGIIHYVYCILGCILFGIFLIIDTQMIMGNKKHNLSYDDYIVASLQLYLDIIMIFLYLLQILGGKKK